jgi:hypothetical protein
MRQPVWAATRAAHTEIQRRFALEYLGYPVWGLSPSSKPDGRVWRIWGANTGGAWLSGRRGDAARGGAGPADVDPVAAVVNLRQLAERYPLYGDFGFYDAVDPQ